MQNIQKSLIDNRQYRYLELDNKMKVILVSDPDTQKSAASVNVGVGSFSDPADFPGLAHFLEHMLFMGTEKFPDENHFEARLDALGGSYNAYTDSENTVYHFEVLNDGFEEILDIYSRFFIDPLMKKDSVDREINAVDSENTKNLENDLWRIQQLMCELARSEHPAHKFGTGNLETLKKSNVRDVLLEFHQKYYSANIMHLCLITPNSLDHSEELVKKYFSDVVNKNVKVEYSTTEMPYSSEVLGNAYYVKPVKNINRLKLLWQLPNQKTFYKNKSLSLISNILGDENNGSIFRHLSNKGWASSLTCGSSDESYNFNIFELNIDLTLDGLENVNEIISIVYHYVKLVKTHEKWIEYFNEHKQISKIRFDYSEKQEAESYSVALSNRLEYYDVDDLLFGDYKFESFDETQFMSIMDMIRPDNMLTFVIRNKTNDKRKNVKEKYYGTEYHLIENPVIIEYSVLPLELPAKNIYLPDDMSLKNYVNSEKPKEVMARNLGIRLWTCFNNKFKTPKAIYWIQIISPNFYKTVKDYLISEMMTTLWADVLNPLLYNASLMNYHYEFSNDRLNNSITISCDGYNQKLNYVLDTILKTITNFCEHIEQIKFNVTKEKLKQSLENIKLGAPWNMITYNLKDKWSSKFLNYNILLENIDSITLDDMKNNCANMFSHINVKVVSTGNMIPNEVIDIHKYFDTAYDMSTYQNIEKVEPVYGKLEFNNHNKNETNEAIGLYYQVFNQEYDFEKAAKLSMLETLIREPFFDQLRTKEQLGYLVNSSGFSFLDSYGLIFMIQSPVKESSYLAERIKLFQKSFQEKLATYQEFDAQKTSLINMIAEPDKRLNQLAFRIIKEINLQTYIFDRKDKLINNISKLKLEDIVKFYKEYVLDNQNFVEIHNTKA
jgi:insulysin